MLRLWSRRLGIPRDALPRSLTYSKLLTRYAAVSVSDTQSHRHDRRGSSSNSAFGDSASAVVAAGAVLGTTWYMWRRKSNDVSCQPMYPAAPIIVEWQPPPSKPRRRRSALVTEDRGDSKSVEKSTLAGTELETIPAVTASTTSATPHAPSEDDLSKEEIAAFEKYLEEDLYKEPLYLNEDLIGVPEAVPYLIVGSGTAAIAAARAIRGSDATARVLIIGDEPLAPYMRPPLSKELWRRKRERQLQMLAGDGDMKKHSWMFFEPNSFFIPVEHLNASTFGGVALWRNKRVAHLNVEQRFVELASGERVRFEKCLLATGGRPRRLPVTEAAAAANDNVAARIMHFRNAADFEQLRAAAEKGGRIVIVGGGFLGSELAVSLSEVAKKSGDPPKLEVVQVYRETEGNMAHVLPPYLADYTKKFLEGKGVQIIPGDEIAGATWNSDEKQMTVSFAKHDPMSADYIVVAVGLEANTELADDAHLEVDHIRGGFLVNAELEARAGIFAAGDASSYYDLLLGRRRVEHINHAEESGRIAGRNMAGDHLPYHHQSSFWSTLGREISWDAVGNIDAKLDTQAFFALPPENKSEGDETGSSPQEQPRDYSCPAVVFYLKARKVVGILLWNLPDDIYKDDQRYAPSRLNLVRKILDDRRRCTYDELAQLACDLDLYETIAEDFADLKQYMEEKEKAAKDAAAKPSA